MWDETVSGDLKQVAGKKRVLRHRRLKCFGAGESAIEEMLPGIIERGRDPTVGITAHEATITLRISAWADNDDSCWEKIKTTENIIRETLGQLVYGEEEDEAEEAREEEDAGASAPAPSSSAFTPHNTDTAALRRLHSLPSTSSENAGKLGSMPCSRRNSLSPRSSAASLRRQRLSHACISRARG